MPPSFTPPPKTVRQQESYPKIDVTDHLTIPSPGKLITHNEKTGGKTTTFSEKIITKYPNCEKATVKSPNLSEKPSSKSTSVNEKLPTLTKNNSFEKVSQSNKNNTSAEKTPVSKSNSLSEKLPSKLNLSEKVTLDDDEKDKNNSDVLDKGDKCKIQRRYSWKISRPSLRKKNGKSRSGSDSDAILVLNNGRDHSQCNGGGVTRHVSNVILSFY